MRINRKSMKICFLGWAQNSNSVNRRHLLQLKEAALKKFIFTSEFFLLVIVTCCQ